MTNDISWVDATFYDVWFDHLNKAQDELLWSLDVRPPSTPLKDFSSVTPEPIFLKLHVEPSIKRVLEIYKNGYGPLIKMAAMAIYGKKLEIFFSRTKKASRLNLGTCI